MLPFGAMPSADASLCFLSVASRDAAALLAGFVPAPEGQRFEGLMPLRTVAPESPAVLASLFSPTAPPMAQPSTPDSVPSPSGETVAVPEDNPAEEPTEMVPAEFPALPTFVESTPVAAGRHEVPAPLSRDAADSISPQRHHFR